MLAVNYLCVDVWDSSVSTCDYRTGYILRNFLIRSVVCIKKFCKPTMRNLKFHASQSSFGAVLAVRNMIVFILSGVKFFLFRKKNLQVLSFYLFQTDVHLINWMKVWVRRYCRFPADFHPCGLSPGSKVIFITYITNPNSFNFHNQNKIS
jgi:hypothetical protein